MNEERGQDRLNARKRVGVIVVDAQAEIGVVQIGIEFQRLFQVFAAAFTGKIGLHPIALDDEPSPPQAFRAAAVEAGARLNMGVVRALIEIVSDLCRPVGILLQLFADVGQVVFDVLRQVPPIDGGQIKISRRILGVDLDVCVKFLSSFVVLNVINPPKTLIEMIVGARGGGEQNHRAKYD